MFIVKFIHTIILLAKYTKCNPDIVRNVRIYDNIVKINVKTNTAKCYDCSEVSASSKKLCGYNINPRLNGSKFPNEKMDFSEDVSSGSEDNEMETSSQDAYKSETVDIHNSILETLGNIHLFCKNRNKKFDKKDGNSKTSEEKHCAEPYVGEKLQAQEHDLKNLDSAVKNEFEKVQELILVNNITGSAAENKEGISSEKRMGSMNDAKVQSSEETKEEKSKVEIADTEEKNASNHAIDDYTGIKDQETGNVEYSSGLKSFIKWFNESGQ